MAEKVIKRTHKNPTADGLDLNTEVGGDLLGMNGDKDNPSLTAWKDADEKDPEKIGGSMATIEATLNYINKVLNEGDETADEDEDLSSDDLNDTELDMADDGEEDGDDDDDFDDDGRTGFGDDDVDTGDVEECGEDDENFEGYDADDEDFEDDDEDFEDNEDDADEDDLVSDEDDGEEDGEDDFSEGFLWEGDEMPDTEVIGTEPDSDVEDDGDEEATAGISVDIPDDIDPNDVSVTIGDSNYVPDVDSAEDVGEDDDEDFGDEGEDEDFGDEDDVVTDEDDEGDTPVSEGLYSSSRNDDSIYEEDDPTVDDVTDDEDEDFGDDDDVVDDGEEEDGEDDDYADDLVDDEDEDGDGIEDNEDAGEVSEAAIYRALRKLIREDQRSDDPHTEDPSCDSCDGDSIACACKVDDSEAEEDDLTGDEGEVDDADIPIEKGTIQPEEASELRWMAKRLRGIMEGDEDSHKEDGKTTPEPLDNDAEDILGDISDSLENDSTLTDTGNGAVEDGETTLGTPDEAEKITDNDDVNYVASNGEKVDDDDEEKTLTDDYHVLMNLIDKTFSEGKKKGKKKLALKKVDKKKKGKKVREGVTIEPYPELHASELGERVCNYNSGKTINNDATATAKAGATLENTVLGTFNSSEMSSVLKSLNNAFGTGSTVVSKEIRDSQVVSEVAVPTKALPIAENASWNGVVAGKMLVETAYKSESKVNTDLLKLTHLYWENDGSKASDYKFPIASIVEGKAQIIPEAIDEATQLFASPSFILRFSESALKKIRNVLDFYNAKMGKTSPWKENTQIQVTEAAKITMIDRTQYNPYAVLKRLSEQENAKKLLNLRG